MYYLLAHIPLPNLVIVFVLVVGILPPCGCFLFLNFYKETDMTTLTQAINALDTLREFLLANEASDNKQEVVKEVSELFKQKPKIRIRSATTTEVNKATGKTFYWKPLRDYCRTNSLDIDQVEINGLDVNDYPHEAWLHVYDINLDTLFLT